MLERISAEKIVDIASEAGKLIMAIYNQPIAVTEKEDKTPLTMADKASNEFIVQELKKLNPSLPILSEEIKMVDYEKRKNWEWFWMVDPLDGTKEFIKKNGEFTVNIALIHKQEAKLGVVYLPEPKIAYFAVSGSGAFKVADNKTTQISKEGDYRQKQHVKVVASRSHKSPQLNTFLENLTHEGKTVEIVSKGSALKFCMVAEGEADVYPRLGPTMEWDTAASQIVAEEAGCKVLEMSTGMSLVYNKEDLLNPHFIVY